MSAIVEEKKRKVTTYRLKEMKERGEKISMLTAYDYSMASIIDQAGMDVILVGDSASNVMAGNTTTLPMTLDQIIYHGSSVMKAVKHALVVVDMPFGTCSGNPYLGEGILNNIKHSKIEIMPHIIVKIYPGSSEEQKSKLSEEITKVIMNSTNKPEAAVSVAIEEVAENEWMEKVYETQIRPNLEKLYKKPGY